MLTPPQPTERDKRRCIGRRGRDADVIKLLLEGGAPLEPKNGYGGTVLDQTVWFALNAQPHGMGPAFDGVDYPAVIETMIAAGANVHATSFPTGNKLIDEVFRRHGATS